MTLGDLTTCLWDETIIRLGDVQLLPEPYKMGGMLIEARDSTGSVYLIKVTKVQLEEVIDVFTS